MRMGVPLFLGLSLVGLTSWAADKAPKAPASAFELTKDEQALVELTNKEREKEKLPPLKPNETLTRTARAHSENMARKNEMNHVLDGKNPVDRIKAAGYIHAWVAENVAEGAKTPDAVVKLWMNSEHHKANILDKNMTEIGVGIAPNAEGRKYYTQVFASPKRK